jgi:putative hemolysin
MLCVHWQRRRKRVVEAIRAGRCTALMRAVRVAHLDRRNLQLEMDWMPSLVGLVTTKQGPGTVVPGQWCWIYN